MKTISLSEAKSRLSEILRDVEDFENYYLTKNGRVTAVVVNPDEWEAIQETLEILADENLMHQIRLSKRSRSTHTLEEVFKDIIL